MLEAAAAVQTLVLVLVARVAEVLVLRVELLHLALQIQAVEVVVAQTVAQVRRVAQVL